jgi:hypothetical protein
MSQVKNQVQTEGGSKTAFSATTEHPRGQSEQERRAGRPQRIQTARARADGGVPVPPGDCPACPPAVAMAANPSESGAAGRARLSGALQRQVGNVRLSRMLSAAVQRQLNISAASGADEPHADRVADRAMRTPQPSAQAGGVNTGLTETREGFADDLHAVTSIRRIPHQTSGSTGNAGPETVSVRGSQDPAVRISASGPRIARDDHVIKVDVIASRDEYQVPGGGERYRVGDAADSRLLMDIQEQGTSVVFRVFNFETGSAEELPLATWQFYRGAGAVFGSRHATITRLGSQLSPSRWRSLWPNPMPELLRMFEAGSIAIEDEALLSGYRGMIRSDAGRSLDENERIIDQVLGAPDRVSQIQEYATGLREASLVRDTLVSRRDDLSRRLVAQHAFTFGLPHAGTGPNMVQQLAIQRERAAVEDALAFWLQVFPLLTRLQTHEIGTASVEARLREIKTNIVSTREQLNRAQLDPMTLDAVRARLAGRLGPLATAVVQAEDRSRARWATVRAVGTLAATVAILFLPGGVFIDTAIGVAIAGHAIANAQEIGHAANTGLHVDDGLVTQAQAQGARFAAVLATVFAVMGAAAAGFRVLRVGLALRGLARSMPELASAERAAVARALANDPALLSAFTRMEPGDAAVSARVAAAVREAAGNVQVLRGSLQDIARIAAIPRRALAGNDLYEPLRRITDGSDIERIAIETGMPRAQVEAAKRNLMLDEHILVDNTTGALYRARFEPFEDIARLWGRAARGERLADADREFLRRLVRHEQSEGAILGASQRTLERAFLRGELEGNLRTFLQSRGWNQARIDRMLAVEPRPMTPYRYAHLVASLSGAPNP